MSYVLGLSFEYHRYHRDAVIKIYADDQLVDEFSLTKDIKLKAVNTRGIPPHHERIGPENYTSIVMMPEKLFLFEISEKFLHDRIRIEIENSNNNHTNGFMTEYSYIRLWRLFVIPDCLLQYKPWTELPLFDLDQDMTSQSISREYWKTKYGSLVFSLEIGGGGPETELENLIVKTGSDTTIGGLVGCKKGGDFTIEIPLNRTQKIEAPIVFDTVRILSAFNVLNMST